MAHGLDAYGDICEKNVWSGTTRVLRVTPLDVGLKLLFDYEPVGHGSVSKLVDRHVILESDIDSLVASLNEQCQGLPWSAGGGPSGLVALCQTTTGVSTGSTMFTDGDAPG